jgi:hypothetical protein
VAKRVRGSRSAHRPGGQGPSRTSKSSSADSAAASDASDVVVDADIDAAVESVGGEYTELAIEETAPKPVKTRRTRRSSKVKADSLQARAATEDVYVREDLRRIGVVSVILVVMLIVAWIVFVAMDVLNLY